MQPYATAVPMGAIARLIVIALQLLVAPHKGRMHLHNLASTLQVSAHKLSRFNGPVELGLCASEIRFLLPWSSPSASVFRPSPHEPRRWCDTGFRWRIFP